MAEAVREDSQVWKIPPWQVAVLFLLTVACAAVSIYAHPVGSTRIVTILIGVIGFLMAVAGLRMYLVVDGEGAAVRFVGDEQWLPWPSVERIEVATGVRGSDTIRFTRNDGTYVNVPPSLLQPSAPTSKLSARRRLEDLAHQFDKLRTDAGN